MKKSRILALLSAFTITAVSSVPMISSAVLTLPTNISTLDDLVNCIDIENNFVKRTDKNIFVVNQENPNSVDVYRECENAISVTVKKGTELEKDSLTDNGFDSLVKVSDNVYLLGNSILLDSEGKNKMVNALKEIKNVVSVDYCTAIAKNEGFLHSINIESNLTDEEIQERYSIEGGDFNSGKDIRYFNYADAREYKFNVYDIIHAIQNDSDIKSADFGFVTYSSNSTIQSGGKVTENLYTAPIKGDVNGDGEIDISDIVAITAFVGNSEKNKFNSDQKIINGDVYNSGDGLTANDALMIQQYISGNLENLE